MPELETPTTPEAPVTGPPSDDVETALLTDDDGLSFDSLDSPMPVEAKPETAPVVEKPTAETPVVATAQPEDARRQQLIEEHAKKLGIAPTDPQFAGVLKQLADKDLYIEQLKAGAGKPPAADSHLTEYERQLLAAPAPAEPKKEEPPKPVQTAEPVQPAPNRIAELINGWKSPADPYTALNEAWAASDLNRVAEVENAMFVSRSAEFVPQLMERMIPQLLQQVLGKEFIETLPEIQEVFRSRRNSDDAAFAISELKKTPQYSDLDKLYEKEGEGEIEMAGQKVPKTALNRIISENDWIIRIPPRDDVKDPRAAARIGYMDRLRAAHRIFKSEQAAKHAIDPKQAQTLVETGRVMEKKAQSDQTRQSLNAGSGATTAGSNQPARQSYVKELIAARTARQGLSLDALD